MNTVNEELENQGFVKFVQNYLFFLAQEGVIEDINEFQLEPILDVTNDLLGFFNHLDNKKLQ